MDRADSSSSHLDAPRAKPRVRSEGASAARKPAAPGLPAPAVAAAARILDYLVKTTPRAGVSEIARALGLNKSSCYNVLVTLAHFGMIAKLPGTAQYQLGPRLAELGGAVRRQFWRRDVLREQLRALVAETQLVCVIGQILGDDTSWVIIDRIAPPGASSRSPAPPVGAVFPLTAPALGRALLSSLDEEEALAIARHLLPGMSAAQEHTWREQLAEIRERGYATSIEQHQPGVNAVATPVAQSGEAYLVIGVIAHARDLPARRMNELGRRLVHIARDLQEYGREADTGGDAVKPAARRPSTRNP